MRMGTKRMWYSKPSIRRALSVATTNMMYARFVDDEVSADEAGPGIIIEWRVASVDIR